MPADAALKAITRLKLKSGKAEFAILHGNDYAQSHAVLTEVLGAPKPESKPESTYETVAFTAARILSFLGLNKKDDDKDESGSAMRPGM